MPIPVVKLAFHHRKLKYLPIAIPTQQIAVRWLWQVRKNFLQGHCHLLAYSKGMKRFYRGARIVFFGWQKMNNLTAMP